jgi:LPS-assembly protein
LTSAAGLIFSVAASAQFTLPIGVSTSSNAPVSITGRTFVFDQKTDIMTATGDAQLQQQQTLLQADIIEFERRTHQALATGSVHYSDPAANITASSANIDSDNETGELTNAKLTANENEYYLAGKKIQKLFGQNYDVQDGYFTTCGCESGTPSWSISGKDLNVHLGGTGTVRDASFNILGHPVLDFPYAVFPADTDRHTGFLEPRMGQSHQRGIQYLQPYFIDINKSQDATLAFDAETQARIGALGEYRIRNGEDDYLKFTSAFFNESIRKNANSDIVDTQIADPHIPVNRYAIIGDMRQHLTPSLTLFADATSVSDSLYLREMNIYGLSAGYGDYFTTRRTADSHFGLLQNFNDSYFKFDGTWIQDTIQPQKFALQTLPEAVFSGRQKLFGGLAYSDFDFQAIDYYRYDGVQGRRFDANPRLTVPFRWQNYFFGNVTAEARETVYDVSGHNLLVTPVGTTANTTWNNALSLGGLTQGGLQNRNMLYGSAEIGTVLDRIYRVKWGAIKRIKHTIEPLVLYNYVPNYNQNNLPLFDETDRVNARSLITGGVTSRIYAQYGGAAEPPPPPTRREQDQSNSDTPPQLGPTANANYSARGGNTAEIARFTVLQAYDVLHSVTGTGSRLSDSEVIAAFYPNNIVSLGGQAGYSSTDRKLGNASFYLNLRPPWEEVKMPRIATGRELVGGSFLQIGYNFIGGRVSAEAVTIRAYYEMFDRLGLYYAPSYDITNAQMTSSEYGVRVKSKCDCWAVDAGAIDTFNPHDLQFQVQVTLGGIGSFGKNPFGYNPLVGRNSRPGIFSTQY